MDNKQRLGLASYYQQQILLVTEHEKAHYQRFQPDRAADNGSYPQVLLDEIVISSGRKNSGVKNMGW
jgi:hypothetical protein